MDKPQGGADIPASSARADITPSPSKPPAPDAPVQPQGQYSADGRWFWNGTQWVPAQTTAPSGPAECMVCGATPAVPVTLRSVVAMVVFGVTSTFRGVYCRDCGLAMFRKRMNGTLLTGWWGILHFFINLGVIAGNLGARAQLMRLAPPIRNPGAGYLDPGRPVFLRGGFIVSAAILLVTGSFVIISATIPPTPFPAEDQAYIGQCAQRSGTEWTTVDCAGPHDGKVVSLARNPADCPDQDHAVKLPDGNYTCIDTTK